MLAVYARAVKLIAFFCPMVTNWLLNMRTRQNIKLQLKIRLNLSLTVTTLNSPVPSRHHGFFLCLLFRWRKKSVFYLALRDGHEKRDPGWGSRKPARKGNKKTGRVRWTRRLFWMGSWIEERGNLLQCDSGSRAFPCVKVHLPEEKSPPFFEILWCELYFEVTCPLAALSQQLLALCV